MVDTHIFKTKIKQLSPEFTIVWYWFDHDLRATACGLYQFTELVSMVNWSDGITLAEVEKFMEMASDFQKMPGVNWRIPERII